MDLRSAGKEGNASQEQKGERSVPLGPLDGCNIWDVLVHITGAGFARLSFYSQSVIQIFITQNSSKIYLARVVCSDC